MEEKQPRFYWSCSSMLMKDATPLTPSSALLGHLFITIIRSHHGGTTTLPVQATCTREYRSAMFGMQGRITRAFVFGNAWLKTHKKILKQCNLRSHLLQTDLISSSMIVKCRRSKRLLKKKTFYINTLNLCAHANIQSKHYRVYPMKPRIIKLRKCPSSYERQMYTHGFGVVRLVVERFDEVGDDGGDEEDGDQEGSDKLPHDLPVHMGLRPDHELDVVAEPGSESRSIWTRSELSNENACSRVTKMLE